MAASIMIGPGATSCHVEGRCSSQVRQVACAKHAQRASLLEAGSRTRAWGRRPRGIWLERPAVACVGEPLEVHRKCTLAGAACKMRGLSGELPGRIGDRAPAGSRRGPRTVHGHSSLSSATTVLTSIGSRLVRLGCTRRRPPAFFTTIPPRSPASRFRATSQVFSKAIGQAPHIPQLSPMTRLCQLVPYFIHLGPAPSCH